MNKEILQPIDKLAIALIVTLSLVIGFLVWGGNVCGTNCLFHTGPKVSNFSWQNKKIGREERAFLLTFDRPMDRSSVEKNLIIEPPLPGKISWSGLRLAYTLETPVLYGETYQLSLQGAKERFAAGNKSGEVMEPYVSQFSSRDRAFAYIGSQGEEKGRLILYNWTKQQKKILTPADLIVFDFESYPQGDRLLFSAADASNNSNALSSLQLYTVTTGLNSYKPEEQSPKIKLILDNQDYQNNKFDLSQDGKIIVVQRINRHNPKDFGIWLIREKTSPQPLNRSIVGDFLLTPDSKMLAVAQGEGIALLPLQPQADPLDFLPRFGRVITFSSDGTAAVMVNYNTDNPKLRYTRSLFYVNNQGVQKELLNVKGSILDCQFNPTATHLYCLLTQLQSGEEYREQPYIAEIDLETATVTPLLALPEYQDSKISMAPDGLGILFDQVLTGEASQAVNAPTSNSGEVIINSRLWLLIPPSTDSDNSAKHEVEQLPFIGFRPQWLP
ncbi:hypothetical protein IQ238_27375 [Pleurocapsales cyanobacterium LEGE 06147]|nr:hypothetical protein [Pleurocapsales cyanobacterium LEGE 06147]